jgi:hypothetical protein
VLIGSGAQVIVAPLVDIQHGGNREQHRRQRVKNNALTVVGVIYLFDFFLSLSVILDYTVGDVSNLCD